MKMGCGTQDRFESSARSNSGARSLTMIRRAVQGLEAYAMDWVFMDWKLMIRCPRFDCGPPRSKSNPSNPMTASTPGPNSLRMQSLSLAGWLLLCFSAAGSAVFVKVDGWYAGLNRPAWNPPPWVFGPAWTLLYAMMAIAAWLVWREGGWRTQGRALRLFLLQWLLNALWTPLFFGLHSPGIAFAEIMALWSLLSLTLLAFWQVRRAAGLLLVPYLAWVSFAGALNYTIWRLNP